MNWKPTIAHVRATAAGVLLATVAVLGHRPDLLVFAAPFLAIAVWSTVLRPTHDVHVEQGLAHHAVREG
ncbi:MAG: hypothetical protein JWN99_116, partial [Ilumatobacteraceae bacterium]|nr:hypothetical protein [Ilumatobacteraceae bacterium]